MSYNIWAIEESYLPKLNQAIAWFHESADVNAGNDSLKEYFSLYYSLRNDISYPDRETAVISIKGAMATMTAGFWELIGNTSYESIIKEIQLAQQNKVKNIVLELHTSGGSVCGLDEVIKAMDAAKKDGIKFYADIQHMACSAGYWIACNCDVIVGTESSVVGSVGVISVWLDQQGMLKSMGLEPRVMTNEGATLKSSMAFGMMNEEQIDNMQKTLDDMGMRFANFVRSKRPNIDESFVTAKVYYGSNALANGLVDDIY